jgi:hypothetical protein
MRQVVVAIALLVLGLSGRSEAQGLSQAMLMGRWCTDGASAVYSPTQLTIVFTSGQQRVWHIRSIEIDGARMLVNFVEDGPNQSEANRGVGFQTVYANFVGDRMSQLPMTQDNGAATPVRNFHRC